MTRKTLVWWSIPMLEVWSHAGDVTDVLPHLKP